MTMPPVGTGAASAPAAPNLAEGGTEIKKRINQELWQACAGPLVNLPVAGTHVVYFPQGHSEQVAASLKKDVNGQVPNYPSLPSKLVCLLHNVTLHADSETDEVYAQMTLQPVPSFDKDALLRSDLSLKTHKPQPEFFCKNLTASDTSTHGGFSVPRRAAEKIFPPLDYSMTPPAQEIVARDLHDTVWTFRHIYRGQPKRHLLTTGWSLFVSGKKLLAGDSVLFIRDEKQQLLLGIRRANQQSSNLSSSVLSSDSMHIGVLAAAAHAAANNSPFTVFYNPRASPSEFVIPLAMYYRAVHGNQLSLGMRFRMMFETEDSGTRRYMGTITGISDLDPVRWKNSQWRNLQVGWDESTAGEKRTRVSVWEIEPVTAPFFICPPQFFRSKRPRDPGMPDADIYDLDNVFKRTIPWLVDDFGMRDCQGLPGMSLVQWMNMQQNPSQASTVQPNYLHSLSGSVLQNLAGPDFSCFPLGIAASQIPQPGNLQFNNLRRFPQQGQQMDQLPKLPYGFNTLGSITQPLQQLNDATPQSRQNVMPQTLQSSHIQAQILHPQNPAQGNNSVLQQQIFAQNQQLLQTISQNLTSQQLPQRLQPNVVGKNQQQSLMQSQISDHINQHLQMPDNQIQLQMLQKLQQQQQALLAQHSALQQPAQFASLQDQQRQPSDGSHTFSRSVSTAQVMELPQALSTSVPQSNTIPPQTAKVNGQSIQFSRSSHQPKLQEQQTMMLPEMPGDAGIPPTPSTNKLHISGGNMTTGFWGNMQSVTSDDGPSCSTSPSTNNCPSAAQLMVSTRLNRSLSIADNMGPVDSLFLNPHAQQNGLSDANIVKDHQQNCEVKPTLNISKGQNQRFMAPHSYLNGAAAPTDYFDTSSSTASVCISQNELGLQQNNNSLSYNPSSILMRDTSLQGEVHADLTSNIPYVNDVDGQPGRSMNSDPILTKAITGSGKDLSDTLASGGMLANYENSKDVQAELSSSMVSQSFGVPDLTFNSIDSTINETGFLSQDPWAPPSQFQRMRTYTKVYKRGAVGRSIDITRYSGYNELKEDLARRFGIEGQLEDRGRIGWKLVYVDHEKDVLLVGDDPWEEFVNCVRCIKILSPQEVQQMSLDGDLGSCVFQNQACSSSDNGP